MTFIKLTRGEQLIVLNTAHIAQVEVSPNYETVITMADGEQIYVDEDLPTVLALLMPEKAVPASVPGFIDGAGERGFCLRPEQIDIVAAALYQLADCVNGDFPLDPDAQSLMAPIARRIRSHDLRVMARNILKGSK